MLESCIETDKMNTLYLKAGTAAVALLWVGHVTGTTTNNPPAVYKFPEVHTVVTKDVPGATVYKNVLPADCRSAISIVHQINPILDDIERVDSLHIRNQDASAQAIIEHSLGKLNKQVAEEYRLSARLQPDAADYDDLVSSLTLYQHDCEKAVK